ncbi:MAG: ATP-binding protein [Methanocorpusculum sp.]|nr:ATP-binding protein [Methanocorpusculum sp.]
MSIGEIKRDRYLNELISRKQNGLIKVVTGLRRVGKSYLLFTLFYHHLLANGVDESHILKIQLDQRMYAKYQDPDLFLSYIESKIADDTTRKKNEENVYYILLDEVQLMRNFESALNSLLSYENVDVYVTGSNSKFLSRDVITEFRGRGDEIHVYPLSFSEFLPVYDGDIYQAFDEYMVYGGLPACVKYTSEQQKITYLKTLFQETYLVDILQRYKFRNTEELSSLLDIIASDIGSLTNPLRIRNTFSSVLSSSISRNTITEYLLAFEDAFLIKKAMRYDIRGRKYIGTPLKYYFEDTGLRNARLNFRQIEDTYLMENVIYIELCRRGFSVDVGVIDKREKDAGDHVVRKQYEIDFVANLGSRRYYIQSAFSIPDEEKRRQESRSLLLAEDNFRKVIIVGDRIHVRHDDAGVTTLSIYDFLLKENALDL